jgi:ABC-type branched-subunit amino acid transport system substrate-binding protein
MKRRDLIGALGGTLAGACGPLARAQERGPIVLGQSAALSGPAGELGHQLRLGANLLFSRVNAQGGVAGRRIELQSLDDGHEPRQCVLNTRQLIDAGAVALFGYVGTATSLAALPLASAAGRVFFAPFTGSEALRIPYNPLAFHLRASYVDETRAIVRHLTSVGIKRIGVFYQNDGEGKAGLLGVARALKLQYQQPAGLGFVERNGVHVAPAVQSVLAAEPDAIVQIGAYRSCAAFIRAARRAGFRGVFYNTSFVGAQALALELGADVQGVVVSQVMPYPFSPRTRLAGEYLAAGRLALGDRFSPSYGSIEGYVAAKALVEGLRRIGGGREVSPAALVTALESLNELDLGDFRIAFGPGQHAGSRFIDLTMLIENGRVRL